MKKQYIHAVVELIERGIDIETVLKGLTHVLRKRGHMRLYAPILRGILVRLDTSAVASIPRVVTNSKDDFKKHKETIEAALSNLKAEGPYEEAIDDTLIGGFIAEYDNKMIDASYKSKLLRLYRTITRS